VIQRYRVDATKGQWCLKPMSEGDCVLYFDHAEALAAKDASIETWKSRSDRCDQQANMWEQRALEAGARAEKAEAELAEARRERDRLREALHHLNVCANTLDYCYFRNLGKFSAALSDLRNSADKARAALEGKP
jgi:chromosome segregation ATPase